MGTIKQGSEIGISRNMVCSYNAFEHTFGVQVYTENMINGDFIILSKSYVSPNFSVKLKSWVTIVLSIQN